jgi:hypothetical protein
MTEGERQIVTRALERNQRYLLDLVEALNLCPFAKACREGGALERRVLLIDQPEVGPLVETVKELHGAPFAHVEVALLILPRLVVTPIEMDRLMTRLRDVLQGLGLNAFFAVGFHPDAVIDATTPARLVQTLRRSPDPTVQLVRAAVLDRVRGSQSDTRWIDPKKTDLSAPPPPPPPSLSERIASANFETVRRVGLERMVELLGATRHG